MLMENILKNQSKPKRKISSKQILLALFFIVRAAAVSEYSFNPMKYYDDKFEAYNILNTKPRTFGESLFFAKVDKTFPRFMERESVFHVPQVPLEPPFENYYSNFYSLLMLNSRNARYKNDHLKGFPRKREFMKTHGIDLESLRFRHPKTGRDYDLQEVFESKRMDPLYDFAHRMDSPNFHLFLEKEKMKFAEDSGLKQALLSQIGFQSLDQSSTKGRVH